MRTKGYRSTTCKNYYSIWRHFNSFLVQLGSLPTKWEERLAIFCAHLIQNGTQSSTLKSYISAIKAVLRDDNYGWNNDLVLISSLTRACRQMNDIIRTRLPIQIKLLELIVFEIERYFNNKGQYFLKTMYKTLFLIGYYGLFRIGELTTGGISDDNHTIKACNINIAQNKDKILIILYSSKTHSAGSLPQKVKITGVPRHNAIKKFFCPFKAIKEFVCIRGGYSSENDPFFVFQDSTHV